MNAATAATFNGVVLILINIVRVSVRRRYALSLRLMNRR
jgi:hypothetical protein